MLGCRKHCKTNQGLCGEAAWFARTSFNVGMVFPCVCRLFFGLQKKHAAYPAAEFGIWVVGEIVGDEEFGSVKFGGLRAPKAASGRS